MRPSPASLSLLRSFQLVSQSLPVGAYAYSQGLETAIEAGWVSNESELEAWLDVQLRHCLARTDLPIMSRLYEAIANREPDQQIGWARHLAAMRETSELRADDCGRGRALARLLDDLGVEEAGDWLTMSETPFAALAALASAGWSIPCEEALAAYAWGWLENQVLVGVKLIPLGQVSGQRMLLALSEHIPQACDVAMSLPDDELGATLPLVAIASSRHETQYSRLFRS